MGLLDYQARFYAASVGRFVSADTVVPGAGQVMAWDRYNYVMGNPLNNVDPSGHRTCTAAQAATGDETCDQNLPSSTETPPPPEEINWIELVKIKYGITLSNDGAKNWTQANAKIVFMSLLKIDAALGGNLKDVIFSATFYMGTYEYPTGDYYGKTAGRIITFFTKGDAAIREMNIFHEFGHMIDSLSGKMYDYFSNALAEQGDPSFIDNGYVNPDALNTLDVFDPNHGTAEAIQASKQDDIYENWADVFANYVAGNINLKSPQGQEMFDFVTGVLGPYTWFPMIYR